jgi:serine/threonine-protein kinase
MGSAIVLLMIFSAGFIGYATVQLLQNLRTDNNRQPIVSEPSNPEEETSPTDKTPETSSPETKPKENQPEVSPPSPQPDSPALDLELNTPTLVVPTIPVDEEPPATAESSLEEVPIFSTGAKKEQVIARLGKPTSIGEGYWENTESVLYKDYIAGQVDLGLLFDRDTGKLRQTEASFASSVKLKIMEDKLRQMLQGQITPEIREALRQVYRRETDLRSFRIANWKGIIQRQQDNQLYIGVWDKELH